MDLTFLFNFNIFTSEIINFLKNKLNFLFYIANKNNKLKSLNLNSGFLQINSNPSDEIQKREHTVTKPIDTNFEESYPNIDYKFMCMFIGLIDGDGNLEIGAQKQYHKKTKLAINSTIRARLILRLEKGDLELLNYLQSVFNTGSIDFLKEQNQYRLILSKLALKKIIIPLISKYKLQFLVSNRRSQFKLLNYIFDNNIMHWSQLELDSNRIPFRIGGYLENEEKAYLKIADLEQFSN